MMSLVPQSSLDNVDQAMIFDTQHVADPPVIGSSIVMYMAGALGLWLFLGATGRR